MPPELSSPSSFSMASIASLLGVSRSGYYRYVISQPNQQCIANERLLQDMKKIYQASRGTYGNPRIYAAPKAQGISCNQKRVAQLMCANNIKCKIIQRVKNTTKRNPYHPRAQGLSLGSWQAARDTSLMIMGIKPWHTKM